MGRFVVGFTILPSAFTFKQLTQKWKYNHREEKHQMKEFLIGEIQTKGFFYFP